jgi:hypothetical protein
VARRRGAAHALAGLRGERAPLLATVAFAWSDAGLDALFAVEAEPPLALASAPAWANDCVEIFAASAGSPWRYLEVVADAAGGLYTARVTNPDASRATWRLRVGPPPPGLTAAVYGEGEPARRRSWRARLRIPWEALGIVARPGARLRANAFRIARGRATRHLALSPTFRADPPDFHVPDRFATLVLT